ncbi:MAG: TIR domain-containing protein, partial [Caldilineaceae bacterium]|nr:TIR domain-containing protein [Caldilineaceae bacterium]
IHLWWDQRQLRAGSDWRNSIERGITESIAVLVALSANSAESSYVTFEWAYGLGQQKTIIPLKLDSCKVHPRLEQIQYLDFSVPGALPWNLLIEQIHDIETDATSEEDLNMAAPILDEAQAQDAIAKAILTYLNQRGYQMVSYERLRRRIDSDLTDEQLDEVVAANPKVFRHAVLREGKRGLAKIIP